MPVKKRPAKKATRPSSRTGRVHLYVGISLDGYVAGPNHELDWLEHYQDARAGFGPFAKSIGSAIMGRGTYDVAVANGFAEFGMPSYVVTHRPLSAGAKGVVAWQGELGPLVDEIRAKHPKDIWLMGGGRLAMAFADADLIDIWSVAFIPTVLGAGIPMFPSTHFRDRRLTLDRMHKYPSGVVELRYRRR